MWQIFSELNLGHFLPCSSSTSGMMYSGRTWGTRGRGAGGARVFLCVGEEPGGHPGGMAAAAAACPQQPGRVARGRPRVAAAPPTMLMKA
jgi:hypothetical protein